MVKNSKLEQVMQYKSCCKGGCGNGGNGAMYGLGVIGALVYYLPHAATVVEGLLDIGKSLVWPAMLVFRLLTFFKM